MYRDHTKVIQIGNRKIGGGNPILIQSMTNTKTADVINTVNQINELTIEKMKLKQLVLYLGLPDSHLTYQAFQGKSYLLILRQAYRFRMRPWL